MTRTFFAFLSADLLPSVTQVAVVTDVDSKRVTLSPHRLDKVLPLGGPVSEITDALSAGKSVIVTDITPSYPPAVTKQRKLGDQRELTAEGISAKINAVGVRVSSCRSNRPSTCGPPPPVPPTP